MAEYKNNHTMHLKHEGSVGNFRSCLHMQSMHLDWKSYPLFLYQISLIKKSILRA